MELTPGEIFYYGGIVGMGIVALVSILVIIIMSGSRKRLRKKLHDEYGGRIK